MSWCKFGATLYRAILTILKISNSVSKTPRDNIATISLGANIICRYGNIRRFMPSDIVFISMDKNQKVEACKTLYESRGFLAFSGVVNFIFSVEAFPIYKSSKF